MLSVLTTPYGSAERADMAAVTCGSTHAWRAGGLLAEAGLATGESGTGRRDRRCPRRREGDVEGGTDALSDESTYRHGHIHHSMQKITEMIPGSGIRLASRRLRRRLDRPPDRRTYPEITIALSGHHDATQVCSTHVGLFPDVECVGNCSSSLRNLAIAAPARRRLSSTARGPCARGPSDDLIVGGEVEAYEALARATEPRAAFERDPGVVGEMPLGVAIRSRIVRSSQAACGGVPAGTATACSAHPGPERIGVNSAPAGRAVRGRRRC